MAHLYTFHPVHPSSRYFTFYQEVIGLNFTNITVPLKDMIWVSPFPVGNAGTTAEMGFQFQARSEANPSFRVGIYANTSPASVWPSALVIDAGSMAYTGTDGQLVTVLQSVTASLALGGLYWLAIFTNVHSATMPPAGNTDTYQDFLGWNATLNTRYAGIMGSYAYGPFPSTFPAVGSYQVDGPYIGIRWAS